MLLRRRPVLRTAMVGRAAYHAGKRAQEGRETDAEQEARLEQPEDQPTPVQQSPPPAVSTTDATIEQLTKHRELHSASVLTNEAFEGQKQEIVAGPAVSVTGDELADLKRRFEREIFPLLTPLAVDPGHPFPFVPSMSLNLAVFVREPEAGVTRFALIQLPEELSPLVSVGQRGVDIALEDAVAFFLPRLFPRMNILEHAFFRVTRVVDTPPDVFAVRATKVSRLEVSDPVSERLLTRLMREFGVTSRRVPNMLV